MGAALGWGALAASSLVLGALLGLGRRWSDRQVGVVLAFGAGALISAVSFELVEEGARVGANGWVAVGLALGAAAYFIADRRIEPSGSGGESGGVALPPGAVLGGGPPQTRLRLSIAARAGGGGGPRLGGFVSHPP